MIIYIAAPYSKGSESVNIRNAIRAADIIWEKGYTPYIPHLCHLWGLISPKPYTDWIKINLAILDICDAVLRLPGESNRADIEIAQAKRNCQIIYYSIDEIPDMEK